MRAPTTGTNLGCFASTHAIAAWAGDLRGVVEDALDARAGPHGTQSPRTTSEVPSYVPRAMTSWPCTSSPQQTALSSPEQRRAPVESPGSLNTRVASGVVLYEPAPRESPSPRYALHADGLLAVNVRALVLGVHVDLVDPFADELEDTGFVMVEPNYGVMCGHGAAPYCTLRAAASAARTCSAMRP